MGAKHNKVGCDEDYSPKNRLHSTIGPLPTRLRKRSHSWLDSIGQPLHRGHTMPIESSTSISLQKPHSLDDLDASKSSKFSYDPDSVDYELLCTRNLMFRDLARFLRIVPSKSKSLIWNHAMKQKRGEGETDEPDGSIQRQQIIRLLCSCIAVYFKHEDRSRPILSNHRIQHHVQDISLFIHVWYYPLQREQFVNDQDYFSRIIERHINSICGTNKVKDIEKGLIRPNQSQKIWTDERMYQEAKYDESEGLVHSKSFAIQALASEETLTDDYDENQVLSTEVISQSLTEFDAEMDQKEDPSVT